MTASRANAASSWFTIPSGERARIRLFCFPYAGGGSLTFRNWGNALGPSVAVCPAHLPGRERRLMEKPFTNYQSLVEAVAQAILPHCDRPFAFFGHSMGAIISFELARYLRRHNGPQPTHIFVSGRRAPQLNVNDSPTYNLPDAEFAEELRRLNGTPREVLENAELMQLVIPLLRADFEVCQTYQYTPEPPLECPISAFGGVEDKDVSGAMVEAWGEQTNGPFKLWMLPGDHFFVNSEQPRLLKVLSQEL
jgi:medium-chain acyl-[acyl-carrier-protein] hydrolase